MTRIAPRSSAGLQASQCLVEARWRVGVRGSLSVTVLQGPEADSAVAIVVLGSDRVVLAGEIEDSAREVRFAFSAPSIDSPLSLAEGVDGMPENHSSLRSQSRPAARLDRFALALCPSPAPSESDRLLLTDLPTRLGLLGGTYVLDSIRAGF